MRITDQILPLFILVYVNHFRNEKYNGIIESRLVSVLFFFIHNIYSVLSRPQRFLMEVDHFYPTLTPLLTHFMVPKVWPLLQMAML